MQGTFTAIRGGNFWQGAAAGLVSSFAGSASGALGINGGWTIAVSAFTGGVGAYIAGGHTAEEILFGMVSGAMVRALNHLPHDKTEKRNQIIAKKSQTIVSQPNIEMESYTTGISQEGDPATTVVIDARTGKPIEVQSKLGTVGADGSYTVGNGSIQVGTDGRNYILDVSVPTGAGTTSGFSLKLNSQMVNTFIYYTAPLFMPALRLVFQYVPIR